MSDDGLADVISAFQAGHGWVATGRGTQRDDTADYSIGKQSLAISPLAGGGEQATTLTIAATDLSAALLGLRLRLTGATTRVLLRVASGNIATDFAEVLVYEKDVTEPWLFWDGVWAPTWVSRRMFTTTGTVDWAAITRVQIAATASFNDTNALKLNWLAAYSEPQTGVVSITFDDGLATQWTWGLSALSLHEMPATAYVIADVIDSGGAWLTTDQLNALQDDYGWEIAAHAATLANHNAGYDSLSDADAQREMTSIQEWLLDRGLNGSGQFAWPRGQTGKEALAKRIFQASGSTRGASGRRAELVVPQPHDRHHLRRWSVNGLSATVSDLRAAVDQAATDKSWLILCFHNLVTGSPAAATDFRASDFAAVIDYVAASGLPVRTVGDHARRVGLVADGAGHGTAVLGHVAHGADAGAARPAGFTAVVWVGSAEPANWQTGDVWLEP